jgi:hypothetical protein
MGNDYDYDLNQNIYPKTIVMDEESALIAAKNLIPEFYLSQLEICGWHKSQNCKNHFSFLGEKKVIYLHIISKSKET